LIFETRKGKANVMDTCFTEIDASEVQNCFPRFYDQRGRFFEIIHKGNSMGFVGIRPLGLKNCEDCELEVFIFRQYRNVLTKGIVLATLDLPEVLGFKRCWMKTLLKTVVKLFSSMGKSMGKYGIIHVGLFDKKHVFVREF
jgi:hypothetical protein